MLHFIAYYRVSTDRQGRSGLGLEAQQQAVSLFLQGRGELLSEFVEIESGKKNQRPELQAALEACRKHKAVLVIAKLDRLARNVAFISALMDGDVEFVAVDMPEASRLTLHILAAVAEHEREMISKRTKEALKVAKARGVKLGNPTNPKGAAAKRTEVLQHQVYTFAELMRPQIEAIQALGIQGHKPIARELNRRGIPTRRGRQWQGITVKKMLARLETMS